MVIKHFLSPACKTTHTVEPPYNEVLGTMKITLLYQVSHYIRVKKQRNIKSWDQQNYLVIRGFCYIRPLYNEIPLYMETKPYQHSAPVLWYLLPRKICKIPSYQIVKTALTLLFCFCWQMCPFSFSSSKRLKALFNNFSL